MTFGKKTFLAWLLVVLVLIAIVTDVECKKKSKKRKKKGGKKRGKEFYPRPSSVTDHQYCAACRALVKEGVKELKHRKDAADVYSFTSTMCNQERYYIYDYPPPEMFESCIAFISNWEEEIEQAFMKRDTNEEMEQKLCYEITKACKIEDKEKEGEAPNVPPQIEINGQPQMVNPDGTLEVQTEDL
ncbi:unnamed protein product [Moneuplotes crassus]|uniref:Saposin B-type domain-containing protein n=1 Tax=Euplotes crassus TaxID=5936 RepID=A0AAD1XUX8_EUPCR|nr:unnamed protein product [Moneuplotes crassus]